MSVPMSSTQVTAQLNKWWIPFVGYKDWYTHNRGARGNGWSDMRGMLIHHTGNDNADQRELLYSGYSDLPGPLCHFNIDQKGMLHLIGWGRANHAGGGDPAVLEHVTKENYTGVLKPTFGEGDKGAVDGNGYFYGVEIGYSGGHPMNAAQYKTLLKLCAAVADFHNWSEKSFIAHGEWNKYKWDPGWASGKMMNMPTVRMDIKTAIEGGPVSSTPPVDSPDGKDATYKSVWDIDAANPPVGHVTTANPTWTHDSILRFAAEQAEAALTQSCANGEALSKIMLHLGIK